MSEVVSIFFWPLRVPRTVWGWLGAAAGAAVSVRLGSHSRQGPSISGFLPSHHPGLAIHPASAPKVRQDPGQPPSHVFLPCCHTPSVTPPREPPSTYVKTHNCQERPRPSPFPPHSSSWVENLVAPEFGFETQAV